MSEDAKESPIQLSAYGYGMMSFATAMAILLAQGFFTSQDNDPLLSWGLAIFAGASGALSLSMVRSYFPNLRPGEALALATALNIFLFGCYFTSYFGYSRIYVMQTNPGILTPDAMTDFWPVLLKTWFYTCIAAAASTLTYMAIQRSLHGVASLITAKN